MRILNTVTVPKTVKGGLCVFLTSIQLQITKQITEGPFGDIEKLSIKKNSQNRSKRTRGRDFSIQKSLIVLNT